MNYTTRLLKLTLWYDQISQSIQADFNGDPHHPREREVADLIDQHFNEMTAYYLHKAVDHRMLKALGSSVRQMLKQIECQTGIEVMLEDSELKI